jgi:hypothetical protein
MEWVSPPESGGFQSTIIITANQLMHSTFHLIMYIFFLAFSAFRSLISGPVTSGAYQEPLSDWT